MPGHFGGSHSHGDKKSNNRTSPSGNRGTSLHGGPKYTAPKAPPSKKFTSYTKENLNPNKDTAAKKNVFISKGASNIDKAFKTPAVAFLSGPLKAGSKKTRGFFYDDVLSSKRAKQNIGYTQKEFEKLSSTRQEQVFKSYMDKITSGATDAFGNISSGYSKEKIVHTNKDGTKEFRETILKSGGGSNAQEKASIAQTRANVVTEKNVGGTTILTTEGKLAEDKKESDDEYDARRTKRRGRRMTILTSQTGAGGNLVLGKPTLLGT